MCPIRSKLHQRTARNYSRWHLKTVATAKHWFDYDLEGHKQTSRQRIDVNVSMRDQVEYFIVPFKAAVQQGHAQSVMCSYNQANGIPTCFNSAMNNGLLRGTWGFDGFIVSDCDALSDDAARNYIIDRFSNGSLEVQAQQALRGGADLNCGALFGEQAAGAVQSGLVHESELDTALVRVWTKAFKLGVVDQGVPDNRNPYAKLGVEAVDTPANRKLALEAALQGVVLLKNQEAILPLTAASISKIALIGPHANGSTIFLGGPNYHGDNLLVDKNTPPIRAQAWLPGAHVTYEQGCTVAGNDTSGIATAVAAAAAADVVVLFLGLDKTIENEGVDRSSLELPGVQTELALAVAEAASAPVIVVLVNGGPLAIRQLKESQRVGAILEAFFPGQIRGRGVDAVDARCSFPFRVTASHSV